MNGGSGLCVPGPRVPQPLLPSGHLHGHGGQATAVCSPALTPAALPAWHSPGPPHRSGVKLAGGPESVSGFIEMPSQLCPSSGFQSLKAHALAFSCFLSHTGNKSLSLGARDDGGLVPWGLASWCWSVEGGRSPVEPRCEGWGAGQAHPEEGAVPEMYCLRRGIFEWFVSPGEGAFYTRAHKCQMCKWWPGLRTIIRQLVGFGPRTLARAHPRMRRGSGFSSHILGQLSAPRQA